jgi:hypothetical protein
MNYSDLNRTETNSSNMRRSKARNYRALAAECERQAELAIEEPHFREMQTRLAKSYAALAETEEWLEGRLASREDTRSAEQEASRAAA